MADINWLLVILRWAHIIPAIILLGGVVHVKLSGSNLENVSKGWRVAVHASLGFLLISGLWTFFIKQGDMIPQWQMIWGIKVLLAIVFMFLASVLFGKSAAFAPMRAKGGMWLNITIAIGILIVLLGGILRYLPAKSAATTDNGKSSMIERRQSGTPDSIVRT